MPKEQPEQQAPPVQRLRVRYAKRGRLRFTSHRDFSRAFERAVFRARVPMAYEMRGCGLKPEEYAIGTRARNTARSKARLKSRWLVKRSRPRLA